MGATIGNGVVYPLKVGERSDPVGSCQSRAKLIYGSEGVETGRAVPKGLWPKVKGQSRPRTC
ncbi:hypothetical protein AIN02nite_09320 [Acetobacter indonesiensis]|uniref:Uncharacterized protein n=1 Tax=Acetobacter indonesiensis TaxID=104101 RepID=A0A6N3T5Q1_9PROT|nr:hypothetical protein AIN02nite_09320 [Acetobacter indonesiensis]